MKHTHITFVGGQSLPVYLGIKNKTEIYPVLKILSKTTLMVKIHVKFGDNYGKKSFYICSRCNPL